MKASSSMAAPWRWHAWQVSMLAGLCLLATWPAVAQEAERNWEVYTTIGMERLEYTAPVTVEVGEPVPVEIPSAVLGTGQGTKLAPVEVVKNAGFIGKPADGPVNDYVMSLAEDQAGNVWVGTIGGLSRFDGQQWTTFAQEGEPPSGAGDLVVDAQGNLWALIGGWVNRFDGKEWTKYQIEAVQVALSPNGDLWFSNSTSALYRLDGQDWWRYGPEDGLPSPGQVLFVTVDRSGVVWTNVYNLGDFGLWPTHELAAFDGHQWIGHDLPGTAEPTVISSDHLNRIWVGTGHDLLVYDRSGWRHYQGRQFSNIYAIVEDAQGRYWLGGGVDATIGYLLGTRRTTVTVGDFSVSSYSGALLLDRRGNLWMGSRHGILRWPSDRLPTSVKEGSLLSAPESLGLLQNCPNPFNQETQIAFALPFPQRISLKVMGISGQLVATLAEGPYPAGSHQVVWNGRDDTGRGVASGLYLCALTVGHQRLVRKLLLVR